MNHQYISGHTLRERFSSSFVALPPSTETTRTLRKGNPGLATSTFAQLLSSGKVSAKRGLKSRVICQHWLQPLHKSLGHSAWRSTPMPPSDSKHPQGVCVVSVVSFHVASTKYT